MSLRHLLAVLLGLSSSALAQELTPHFRAVPDDFDSDFYDVSPAGDWVVVTGVKSIPGVGYVREVFVSRTEEEVPRKLVGPGLPGDLSNRPYVRFTPDGTRILYQSDQYQTYYCVPADLSSAPVELTGPVVADGQIYQLVYSPDGSRAVFKGDRDVKGVTEIYSVPADGSTAPVQLNGPIVGGGDVWIAGPWFAADERVLYTGDLDTNDAIELYSVPIDGSAAPVKLNAPLASGQNVLYGFLTPDGATFVYLADQDVDETFEIYRVPTDGSAAPVRLSSALVAGGTVETMELTPDGSRVVYLADQDTLGLVELYSVPLAGGTPVKLSDTLGGLGGDTTAFWISPDGARVVSRQRNAAGTRWGMQSAPITGGSFSILTAGMFALGDPEISADSDVVLWEESADPTSAGVFELKSVPIDENFQASAVLDACSYTGFADLHRLFSTPDSSFLVYGDSDSCGGLWSVPLPAGVPVQVSTGPAHETYRIQLSSDGVFVTYAQEASFQDRRIFRARVDGSRPPVEVTLPGQETEGIWGYLVSQNDRCIVYEVGIGGPTSLWVTCVAVDVASVAPRRGPFAGGTSVTIRGTGFSPESRVFFDGVPASSVQYRSESKLVAVSPALAAGPSRRLGKLVDVTVTDLATESTLADSFAYSP